MVWDILKSQILRYSLDHVGALQFVAVCYSVLQCVAVCCSSLRYSLDHLATQTHTQFRAIRRSSDLSETE